MEHARDEAGSLESALKSVHSACDAVAVLRSVTLGFVLSVLASACALVEPPLPVPPPDTLLLHGEVRNARAEPVQLVVRTKAGSLNGAVQPASLPAQSTTNVSFYIPLTGDWSITAGDEPLIVSTDTEAGLQIRPGCALGIELAHGGDFTWGCDLFTVP